MTARLVTVQQCNDDDIIVYFDADVIIRAIRDRTSPQLEHLLRVNRPLRRYTTTTLYEVAFARKGDAPSSLKRIKNGSSTTFRIEIPWTATSPLSSNEC